MVSCSEPSCRCHNLSSEQDLSWKKSVVFDLHAVKIVDDEGTVHWWQSYSKRRHAHWVEDIKDASTWTHLGQATAKAKLLNMTSALAGNVSVVSFVATEYGTSFPNTRKCKKQSKRCKVSSHECECGLCKSCMGM